MESCKEVIDIKEIMSMIPHRYPFLLVDKVLCYKLGESITGVKNITFNEPQFAGHFPDNPVMPGVLIVEAMAQISAILVSKTIMANPAEKTVYFLSIDNTKFRRIVQPGDQLILHSRIAHSRSHVWKFDARAEVNNEVVAEGLLTAMIKNKQ